METDSFSAAGTFSSPQTEMTVLALWVMGGSVSEEEVPDGRSGDETVFENEEQKERRLVLVAIWRQPLRQELTQRGGSVICVVH